MKEKLFTHKPNPLADPGKKPFEDTHDYYERQARYRKLAARAWMNIGDILDQADALDDADTRDYLRVLRRMLAGLELPDESPTDDLDPKKNNRYHLQREDGYGVKPRQH